jgi:hypothetical protein
MLCLTQNSVLYFSSLLKLLTLIATIQLNKLFKTHNDFDKSPGGML